MKFALELSELAEKHAGRVAVIGVNNDSMFGHTAERGLDGVKEFLEERKENFRYSCYVDNTNHYARDSKLRSFSSCISYHVLLSSQKLDIYRKTEYRPIPCIVLVVDNEVKFAGSSSQFNEHLDMAIETLYPKEG